MMILILMKKNFIIVTSFLSTHGDGRVPKETLHTQERLSAQNWPDPRVAKILRFLQAYPRSILYFVRSGLVYLVYGSLRRFGFYGYDWSNTSMTYWSATDTSAYSLNFSPSGIYPSDGPYDRWYGFPVRCLVYYVKVSMENIRAF